MNCHGIYAVDKGTKKLWALAQFRALRPVGTPLANARVSATLSCCKIRTVA